MEGQGQEVRGPGPVRPAVRCRPYGTAWAGPGKDGRAGVERRGRDRTGGRAGVSP
ncbi:hypothetical protein F750_2622 [Streptomyces sp. PAMC 26508]|nr:hypothetical protein F750_2622 [Streptomyces sp. PAMC 26508]